MHIKRTKTCMLLFLALLLSINNNAQEVVSLFPDKDAYVISLNPNTNKGASTVIMAAAWTSGGTTFYERSFIHFNLVSIPENAVITGATLQLNNAVGLSYGTQYGENGSYLQRVNSSWSETTITWNNQPPATSTGQVVLPKSTSTTQNYIVDITAFVQGWVNGTFANNGVLLKLQNEAKYRRMYFRSSEHALSPVLKVSYFIADEFIPASPDMDKNYVHVRTPQVEVKNITDVYGYDIGAVQENISYFDGLGRVIQKVQVQVSPSLRDIVQTIEYDEFGREKYRYLPFAVANNGGFVENAVDECDNFYFIPPANVANTTQPYTEQVFDNSPLNRVMETVPPGIAWNKNDGTTIRQNYTANAETDWVHYWHITNDNKLSFSSNYLAGTLYLTETYDENNNLVQEFKNKKGQVVLKRAFNNNQYNTYYVYDDFGLLRYVLPPESNSRLPQGTYDDSNQAVKDWCYIYKYDERHRMTEKKIPGADWVYMVYDVRDRLVATQDGNQRAKTYKEWSFTKYDVLNRPILTGIYKSNKTRIQLQTEVNGYTDLYEERGSSIFNYTNRSFPKITLTEDYLTVTYYDNYNFTLPYLLQYVNDNEFDVQKTDQVRGQITGTLTRVLGTNDWLMTVNYYDKKGRVIQTRTENYLGGMDVMHNQYDFVGKVEKTKHEHTTSDNSETMRENYQYDHAGRLISTTHKINNEQEVVLNKMKYNELGQLIEKNLHGTPGQDNYLQSVDYRYNIRGWMTNINEADLNLSPDNDLFGMDLYYTKSLHESNNDDISPIGGTHTGELTNTGQYNGNISAIKWQTYYNKGLRAYAFTYDKLNRLHNANYAKYNSSTGWKSELNRYSVNNIDYDLNGNITGLERSGKYGTSSYGKIDILDYSYTKGNQLENIDDYSGKSTGYSTGLGQGYDYDANGNMENDGNKGIQINYNYLNLPEELNFTNNNKIEYLYTAGGTKLRKRKMEGNSVTEKNYCNGFVYNNNGLEYIQTSEGRIVPKGSSYEYQYNLTDHLGNVRVSFRDNGSGQAGLIQENHYYPFGMAMDGLNYYTGVENKYKYNGKEFQDDLGLDWYDYGARMYDPAIARWHEIDPLAEMYSSLSPYNYVGNNPIRMIDPNGMSMDNFDDQPREDGKKKKKKEKIEYKYEVHADRVVWTGSDGSAGAYIFDDNKDPSSYTLTGDAISEFMDGLTDGSSGFGESGGGDMNGTGVLRNVGNAASFGSGVIGLTQIGMLEYRMALPLSSKIGTFSRFSSTYSSLGKFGGKLGTAGALVGVGFNINALSTGEIGVGRFAYRTGSIGASIVTGVLIGGPWGAVAGATVGGISTGFEYIYDNMLVPLWNETNRQIYNFENAIKHGWYPGR